MTATWSAKDKASAWSCVTNMVVIPADPRSSATASKSGRALSLVTADPA